MRDVLVHLGNARTKAASLRERFKLRAALPPNFRWAAPNVRMVTTVLVIASAYYVGTLIGFSVRFQSSPISPIWPPNTILLVALLLVPMRTWRMCLLAVLGAHMLAELPNGVPLVTAAGLYLTNSAEAVLGAFLVWRFVGGPPWLGNLRRMALYLAFAVVMAPVVTSFADAAVVVLTGWGANYWLTWSTRSVSNSLAELTIGPALLLGLTGAQRWIRDATRWRRAEAFLVALLLLIVGVIAFGDQIAGPSESPILISSVLPLLLWAAVRFGVGGTSASLLGITIVATWTAAQGRGPFSMNTPASNVISLQLFLIGISVPMLFLAALLQERDEAKATLQESEARFRMMADHAPTLIWMSGSDTLCTYFNVRWLAFTGRSLAQERGTGWTAGIHPEDLPRCRKTYLNAFAERQPFEMEYRLRRHDGTYRWLVDHGVPRHAPNGHFEGYIGSAIDITERKQAELALRESEERYRAVVNNFPHGAVLLFGEDLRHLVADGQGLAEMGLSKEAIEGKTIWETFPADVSAALAPRYQAALSGAFATFDHVHAGHTYRIDVVPVRYADSSVGMAVMQDITEQRRAEALAELDRAKTEFFSNVSHELRTPLTLLLGPAADALADRDDPLSPRQQDRLEIIQRSGLRLHKLVNTLLDFSRIEAGRLRAAYEPTDVAALTAELASTFRSAIEHAGLRLVIEYSPLAALPQPVYVDRDMWEKIVLNLLSNALKFTFVGEIVVSVHPSATSDGVELEVRDTGTGIPAEAMPHLFERFYRVQGARARTHEGTGIGLALVQELVHLHGGSVRVESMIGVGSSFIISLPVGAAHLPANRVVSRAQLTKERSATSVALGATPYVEEALSWLPDSSYAQTAEASRAYTGDVRILVADDNADMRAYLSRLLSEHWNVQAVADGSAALAEARAWTPNLILADVMMPNLDGFALVRALRSDPATRAIPVVLLSARAGEEATVAGLESGADDYLVKPFTARELLARVRTHIELARVHREATIHAAQLSAVFDAMTDGVFVLDAEGRMTHLNPAVRRIFGLGPGDVVTWGPEERARTLNLRDTAGHSLAPEQLPTTRLLRGEVLTGANAVTLLLRSHDGLERTVSLTGGPLYDATGHIVGAVGVVRDVTKLKRIEAALAEQERSFRTLVENSPDIITRFDRNLRHLYANPVAEAMTGISAEARVGKTYAELGLPEAVFGPWEQALREVFASGEPRAFESSYQATDLPPRYTQVRYIPEFAADRRVESVLGITTDITELKQVAEALRQSEELFSKAFHASPVAIAIISRATGRILDVNEAECQLIAYSREEMLGHTAVELGVVDPAELQGASELPVPGASVRDMPIRARTKSGEIRFCHVSTEPIWLSGEECSIAITIDVTERRRAEEAQRAAQREEEQRRHEAERREQVASSMRDVLTILNSNWPVKHILDYIARQAGLLLGSNATAIYTTDDVDGAQASAPSGAFTLQATFGFPSPARAEQYLASGQPALRQAMSERRPVAVLGAPSASDESADTPTRDGGTVGEVELAEGVVEAVVNSIVVRTEPLSEPYRALLTVPIVAQDEVYGGLLLLYTEPRRYSADEVALAMAYGDQVALAIANARLQSHIERAARDAERNRIARELHDTVTQEIFSVSLLAQAIPQVWDHHRDEAERSLNDLYQLTRGALAALRALLLELRPGVLEERPLADLLHQVSDVMTARIGSPVTLQIVGECPPIPTDVKIALYRIVQEALTNVAKHAVAHHITVRLQCVQFGTTIRITVRDDGQGFQTGAIPAGHLGISMMRERARTVGATLRLWSRQGQGTRVVVEWKARVGTNDHTSTHTSGSS